MSRTGVEDKLPWRRVPKAVRQQVEEALGAPVARAARIWGGYSPAPTFRLLLADGRRAFFKATNASSNEVSTRALHIEERVYQELGETIAQWIPKYYMTINCDDWHGLVLEDLGPKSVPPWTSAAAQGIAYSMAEFHRATIGATLPEWIPRAEQRIASENWQRVIEQTERFQKIAAMAGEAAPEALAWLEMISPTIERLMQREVLVTGPFCLQHGDLRSDNLRFNQGRLYLFDWPSISIGRPEWDIVAFAQSVTVEGGVLPEQIIAWYGERIFVRGGAIDSALAWWLAFFAIRAWRDEVPGLPRLRRFQSQQLAVLVQWAARKWSLPEPVWASELLK